MSVALLIVGLSSLAGSALALFRVRHPSMLAFLMMMVGWLVGELALLHLILQVVVAAVLVAAGALDESSGWIGLAALVVSWACLVRVQVVAGTARHSIADDIAEVIGVDATTALREQRPPLAMLTRPFHNDRSDLEVTRDVKYGPDTKHHLDIYRLADSPDVPQPVMIYIHGGGWVSGKKEQQGLPMIHALARQGWIVATVRYRLAPRHRFPTMLNDVELAVEWLTDGVRDFNADGFNADTGFVAISGGSAGGHLAALAALNSTVSNRIAACVPIYGAYDFTDHLKIRGYAAMKPFLQRAVMTTKLAEDQAGWEAASPIFHVDDNSTPFLVVHGTHDVLLWREETRAFVDALSTRGSAPVISTEVPGAQHAFDLFHSVRSAALVDGIVAWLDAVRATAQTERDASVQTETRID